MESVCNVEIVLALCLLVIFQSSILLTISIRLSVHCLVGGRSDNRIESSVERMNAETGEWRLVAPMAIERFGAGVAVLNDQLFVVGGYNGNYLNSMERYCFCHDYVLGNATLAVNIKILVTIRTETDGNQHYRCPLLAHFSARLNSMEQYM